MLENLKTTGIQQAHKEDRLNFTTVVPFPGTKWICGEGYYREGDADDAPTRRAGIFIGPEFGTVSRADLVEAAREAGDLKFDVLIACAFSYDAHCSEFEQLGRIPVLKARMNADLHMATDLKNTGHGNLFVIFGEPDISITDVEGDRIVVKINGVDVFKPSTGEVVSSGPGRNRLLVYRHRLQRGQFLCPTCLFPRPTGSLQSPENNLESGDRRRGMGDLEQRHQPPVSQTERRAHSRESDQSSG